MKNYIKILLVATALLFFAPAKAQFQVVFADPGLGQFSLTNVNGSSTNTIVAGQSYVLKLRVLNNDAVKAIPGGTTYVRIGLGTKFQFDPTYNVALSPYQNYFTYYAFNMGVQDEFFCLVNNLPPGFDGELSFRIKAKTTPGTSTVSANFLVYNASPTYVLSDYNPGNNTASVPYTVTQ